MDTTTAKTATGKKAIPKVPEVLLKKRKLYADLKAKRLRSQVQATKVGARRRSARATPHSLHCLEQEIQTFSHLQTRREIRQRVPQERTRSHSSEAFG